MKKILLILLSMSLMQPLVAEEQSKPKQQPKKSFWTKTKIGIAAATTIATATILAMLGYRNIYGEKKATDQSISSTNASDSTNNSKPVPPKPNLFVALYRKASPQDIQQLIKDGASLAAQDARGQTPLMVAIDLHSDPAVIDLLSQGEANGQKIVNVKNNNGMTPLSLVLTEMSADFAANDMPAAGLGFKTIEILVNNGLVVTENDKKSITLLESMRKPFELARNMMINDTLGLLRTVSKNNQQSSRQEQKETGQTSTYVNAEPSQRSTQPSPLFEVFESFGKQSAESKIKALLQEGASPAIQNDNGDTPLSLAIQKSMTPTIIEMLCKGEINNQKIVNIPDNNNRTPLDHAVLNLTEFVQGEELEIIKVLLNNGAKIEPGLRREIDFKARQYKTDSPEFKLLNEAYVLLTPRFVD